ncbi:MAG: hypothetical protein ABIK67_08185 [candidate division WOR-3 bacterium]
MLPQPSTTLPGCSERPTVIKEAEPLSRRALAILLKFTQRTGYQHPYLQVMVQNYAVLLRELGKEEEDIRRELEALGRRYGVDIAE